MEGDTLITIVVIVLAAGLMIMFPVMTMADRSDDVAQLLVESTTTDFANDIRTTGVLTMDKYATFVESLASTGNAYDVEMTVAHMDENPGKKTTQTNSDKIGENVEYEEYTSQVLEQLERGPIKLKEGDRFTVSVKNTNQTLSQQLNGWLYSITGNDNYAHGAEEAVMITTNGK